MLILSPDDTAAALPYGPLIEGLRAMFARGVTAPLRHAHRLPRSGEADATLLLMPAWAGDGSYGGVKIVNVTPGNAARGLAAVASSYLLFEETTGRHVALIDGDTLTARRTAAASALAADYLATRDARHLLVVGAGHIGSQLPEAYAAVRRLERVTVWNPSPRRGEALVTRLIEKGFAAALAGDLEAAVRAADIISCATLATAPLIRGDWLSPGQHLDLIGSFTPMMREADDAAIARGRLFVDTAAAAVESGDIVGPVEAGVVSASHVLGDLYDLCGNTTRGRLGAEDVTIFKGVGSAVEDLAAATVALERFRS